MIGLVDYDLYNAPSSHFLPNLEIMKLATYYKQEKNTYSRLIDLSETNLESYDKIYFFSESLTYPKIPANFLQSKNIIYGGTGFTNGVYIPFEEELIDYTIPKMFVYANFLKEQTQVRQKISDITAFIDSSYYREYAGNNKLPIPPAQKRKAFYLYDIDFFYPDWEDIIQDITERSPSTIIRVHPIRCKTVSQFFTLRSYPKIERATEIILDFSIPLDEVHYLLKKYSNYFLAEINAYSNIYVTLGESFNSDNQYYHDFIYKMNLLYAFWSKGIPIKIKYIPKKIGYHNPYENISKLVEKWTHGKSKIDKTLLEKIPKKRRKSDIILEQVEYEQLLAKNLDVKNLFIQTYNDLQKRGVWRL